MGYSVCGNFEDVSLVTPYLENGNVVDYIERQELYIEDILCLVEDTLRGLQYLHHMDPPLVHGNLKPSNILINDDGRALLSDYDLADDQTDRSIGRYSERAVRWSSPEVISGELPTVQSDVWSWACVVLQVNDVLSFIMKMVAGHRPYPDVKTEGEIRALLSAEAENRRPPEPVLVPAGVPVDLIELLQNCWDFDPWGRPDVWSCLKTFHPTPEPESHLETDPENVLRWLNYWTAKHRCAIPAEEASGQDDLRRVRKWSSYAETTMPSSDERSYDPSTPLLRETSPELSSGRGAEEMPKQETLSLLEELTSLHHEPVPATEQLVSLHRALGQAAIKMTRNKQKMYSILRRCRDICDYILAAIETVSAPEESEFQPESMLEAMEQSRRLIDALEGTLLEIARLMPVELETFGPGTFASWSQSRATLIKIWNNLGGRPFRAIPDRRVMEFADSTHFDDCAWLSRLLHEVIEPAIALQFPKHEKLPSNVISVMEGFAVLESAVKRRSVELSQGIVIEMATTLARTLAETTSLEKEVVASPSSEDPALEYENRDRLLGALAKTFSDPDQGSTLTPFNLETARWVDDCIMEYIHTFGKAVQECISKAGLDSSVAQEPQPLSSLLGTKLEEKIHGHKEGLEGFQANVVLQTDENDDLVPHSTIKVSEATIPEKNAIATGSTQVQASSTPGRSPVDSVARIRRAISTLRKPITVSREKIGDTLRELHVLLRDDIAPVDRTQSLSSFLPDFERLVQHYPDDFHPDVARILIDVYYDHQIRQGNYSLCLEVALQAAERFRNLSSTNAKFLTSRAEALEKASTSYEILGRYENARACLAEAICVYQQLNSTTGDRQAFRIPLARNLVKYHQVLCRLGRDWDDSDVVNALHEARKIYDSLVWSGESSGQREESEKLGRELADALLELDVTLIRKGDIVEASEVEDQLIHLYKTLGEEEQAEEVKRGGVITLTRTVTIVDGKLAT
ncbi:hypothetical protein FRC01_006628 [Tulasnella sp. 417]|nr:hypothetical protein FRC01_006628 [Tulasnella sp. 417]